MCNGVSTPHRTFYCAYCAQVVSKLQKNEEEYEALCSKRAVVDSDKQKLEQVMKSRLG